MNQLEKILEERDKQCIDSPKWRELNEKKARILEGQKASLLENIIYFNVDDVVFIESGFTLCKEVPDIAFSVSKRSLLEYNPTQRHPIPYIILRNEDSVFVSQRKSGGGEARLHGKVGLIGGHVSDVDVVKGDLEKTLISGLTRELNEEVFIQEEETTPHFIGFMKLNGGVEGDHLGFIYEIWLSDQRAYSKEGESHKGKWVKINELEDYKESMESWLFNIYKDYLQKSRD